MAENSNETTFPKIALTVAEASRSTGLSSGYIHRLLSEGKLTRRKVGKRTLILADELKAFVTNLPTRKWRGHPTGTDIEFDLSPVADNPAPLGSSTYPPRVAKARTTGKRCPKCGGYVAWKSAIDRFYCERCGPFPPRPPFSAKTPEEDGGSDE